MGLKPGDKVASWLTCDEFPETLVLQMASARAGLHLLSIGELAELEPALKEAKALFLSPWKTIDQDYRIDYVLKLVPEMRQTYFGNVIKTQNFPNLHHVIQTSHTTIRGSLKMKQIPVYSYSESNPLHNFEVKGESPVFTYKDSTHTQESLTEFTKGLCEKLSLGPRDILINALTHKLPLSFACATAPGLSGVKCLVTGRQDPIAENNQQKAKALVISPDRAKLIQEPGEVEQLVVAATNQEEIDLTHKLLQQKGVKPKEVISINPVSLKET